MTKLIFDKSIEIQENNFVPKMDLQGCADLADILPDKYQKNDLNLPNIPENVIVRHFIDLSKQNYCVDDGIYPLGSCTMKYNPKVNEMIARLPELCNLHPLQPNAQGSLQILKGLEYMLCEITGMDAFTLNPAAGAQGEFVGILMIKKYFESRGEKRDKIIVPDSAHGTNPASAAMAGYSIIEIASDENGRLPLDQLEFAMKEGDVAGLMLTNPNTLGLFDRNILEITKIVNENGGICYYDGANLNPMLGVCRPGDMGFDIVHVNVHKTFSTPHGGGGPGAGPVGVKQKFVPYLPIPRILENKNRDKGLYISYENKETSIGRVNNFYGNFGVLIRAYAYIRGLGPEGLRRVGQNAVLNANYLKSMLLEKYEVPYDGKCMHEFVIDAKLPNDVTAEDVAKRLLDYGFYAPTIYFPLIVHEAMMIEPTETESKRELDDFIDAMLEIYQEAVNDPEKVKKAPHKTNIGRLDATLAARKPHLRE